MLDPLHPAVVHFPLVLAVLLPFVAVAALVVGRREGSGRGAWIGLVVMSLLLAGSAWLSVETGGQQEEVVESVVPESVIHGHEEAAEALLMASVISLGLVLVGLVPGRLGRGARYVSVLGGFVVLALAVRAGDSGGALVYEHGAAAAYVDARTSPSTAPSGRVQGDRDGRDDDEGREGEGRH